jgi:hypothetical protein
MMTVKSAFGFTLQQLRSGRNFHCGRNGLISQYIPATMKIPSRSKLL